jgi:two-component system nitrogen regulation response regulator GlnG
VIPRWPVAVELVPAVGARVTVQGHPLLGRASYGMAEVGAGVVVELGSALLLHGLRDQDVGARHGLVGESDAIEQVRRAITRVADLDVSVLVRGETGVGKEHVAQAIHAGSGRQAGPCVAVNMAAIAASTAASELFGHARGSFTGAATRHAGVFERAHGGPDRGWRRRAASG